MLKLKKKLHQLVGKYQKKSNNLVHRSPRKKGYGAQKMFEETMSENLSTSFLHFLVRWPPSNPMVSGA